MSATDWLVGVGSILGGVGAVWSALQQRTIRNHRKRIAALEAKHRSA